MRDFPCRRDATAMASDKSLANVPLSHRYEPFLDARQRKREIIFVNLLQLQQQPLCFRVISGSLATSSSLFQIALRGGLAGAPTSTAQTFSLRAPCFPAFATRESKPT